VATPVNNAVGAEGMTALKAHIVGGFSMVVLADSAEVGHGNFFCRPEVKGFLCKRLKNSTVQIIINPVHSSCAWAGPKK
jgi:hypothetical protein